MASESPKEWAETKHREGTWVTYTKLSLMKSYGEVTRILLLAAADSWHKTKGFVR